MDYLKHLGRSEKLLTIILLTILCVAMSGVVYINKSHIRSSTFTEFYVLGANGKAVDYPRQIPSGEEVTFTVGIINNEKRDMNYKIELVFDKESVVVLDDICIPSNEQWENAVSFIPGKAGPNQWIEFLLFTDGSSDIYRSLRLLLDIF